MWVNLFTCVCVSMATKTSQTHGATNDKTLVLTVCGDRVNPSATGLGQVLVSCDMVQVSVG